MTFYPELLATPFHGIAIALWIVAVIGMLAGGYDRKTVLKSSAGAALVLYGAASIFIYAVSYDSHHMEARMLESLDDLHTETTKDLNLIRPVDHMVAKVGSFRDDDIYRITVYVGNYNEDVAFDGSLNVKMYDAQGSMLEEKTYKGLHLQPGEKKELDRMTMETEVDRFEFAYEADLP